MSTEIVQKATIGERIRLLRGSKQQAEVCELIGVSRRKLSAWERGETNISALEAVTVAKVLGCSISWLLTGQDEVMEPAGEYQAQSAAGNRLIRLLQDNPEQAAAISSLVIEVSNGQ